MSAYWVEYEDRNPACVETDRYPGRDAQSVAAEFGKVKAIHRLPYPREPRLGLKSDCPSFCYGRRECLGLSACPQNYACSE